MAFDPDRYLAEQSQEFNPDSYLEKHTPISLTESGLRGAAQGATFGFAPAISGAAQAIPQALEGKDLVEAYKAARDKSAAEFKAAEEANPKTYMASNVAGAIAPALLTGGASAEAGLAKMALQGAKYGAAAGLGHAVSAGEGLEEGSKDVASNALGGAVLGGVGGKLASALGSAPEALEGLANKQALKAAGFGKSAMKNMIKQDVKSGAYAASQGAEAPESQINKIGSLLGEANPYQETPVITAGADASTILDRAQELKQLSGADKGAIVKQFDALFGKPEVAEKFVNPTDIGHEIQSQLIEPLLVDGQLPQAAKPVVSTIQSVLDTVKQFGDQPIPFEKAEQLKGLIQNLANYEQEGSASNQIMKRAGGIINKAIEDSAEQVGESSGLPDLMSRFKQAKDLYGAASKAVDTSTGKVAGEMANRSLGPTDYAAGVVGAAAHGGPGAIAAAVGNKLAKTYGNTVVSAGARQASNVIGSMSKMLNSAPKEAIASFGAKLSATDDAMSKKLGEILIKASEKDEVGKNAMMYSLMQNPGYREALRKVTGQKETQE